MSQRIDAIFENGVFRPVVPVSIADGERVSLDVESMAAVPDEFGDIQDLLDVEFVEMCRHATRQAPSLEEVRSLLNAVEGSLAERIVQERDER